MYQKAESIYYGLVIFVLGTALFVFYPSNPQTTAWQNGVKQQFSVAWQQTIGDGPWFTEVAQIYDGVSSFYDQSANAMIAMISDPQSDADIYYVFHQVYADFAQVFGSNHTGNVSGASIAVAALPPMPADFMTQEPVYNLVPTATSVSHSTSTVQGAVAGAMIAAGNPVNSADQPWVTIQDNYTGQLYCLAVYDGTVNKYLGPCKNDYH